MVHHTSSNPSPNGKNSRAYAQAGVDIHLADTLKGGLKKTLAGASRPEVLGKVGGFGGLFDLSRTGYREPVLVSSVDGVGTKLKLAFSSGEHEGVGVDIVNHCINDVAVLGAEPLFFLDYIGMGRLDPGTFQRILSGMSRACRKAHCALIGGETAQMPGFYSDGEYDLVGAVVGVVEKKKILSGKTIRPGDKLIGLASSGLHTNGYSLASKIFFTKMRYRMDDLLPKSRKSIGRALLEPHLNYATFLNRLFAEHNRGKSSAFRKENGIFGAVHITGGGFTGNIPRVLPENCNAEIDVSSWKKPALFELLAGHGGIDFSELYEVFNMGIGMILMVDPGKAAAVMESARNARMKPFIIGEVTRGDGAVILR
ncbi:MAG: phosphoribosylformylglycinamidine cyclo-ligase [Opitutales bacterium]